MRLKDRDPPARSRVVKLLGLTIAPDRGLFGE